MFALRSILPLVVGLSTVYGASSPAYQSPSPSPAKSGSVTSYKPSPSPSSDSYKPSQASSSAGPVSSSVGGNYPFPPGNWLGFGLDLTTINPSDITTVTQNVLKINRIITLDSKTTDVQILNFTYSVPNNCDLSNDVSTGTASYNTYSKGSDAATALETNAGLSGQYMAITVAASADYSISKTFTSDQQYALFAYNENLFEVQLSNYGDSINNKGLTTQLQKLPAWKSDPATVQLYTDFFHSIGSHTIVGTNYGARFQLTVWASNENSGVTQNWGVDVTASFNGLTDSGQFNASVKSSSQYSTFSDQMQKTASCQGGDPALAEQLVTAPNNDTVWTTFKQWTNTSRSQPDVMSVQLIEMWTLMEASSDAYVSSRANDVQDAFEWIVANPAPHWTPITFSVDSDWGYIGLLSPSAYFQTDPNYPLPARTALQKTNIMWGEESSHNFGRATINAVVVNDGSPIDIQISHGSDGSSGDTGKAIAVFAGQNYTADAITDHHWNSVWFYKCGVNPNVHVN